MTWTKYTQEAILDTYSSLICFPPHAYCMSICWCLAGIPMEEDEDEQDTSIRGRLLMLVNKIKGQAHKAEEPTEKEQAAPCKEFCCFYCIIVIAERFPFSALIY